MAQGERVATGVPKHTAGCVAGCVARCLLRGWESVLQFAHEVYVYVLVPAIHGAASLPEVVPARR
jgi:hypothetical protein